MRVVNCARCGGTHEDVTPIALDRPFAPPEAGGLAWTKWAPCPTNGQPIMIGVEDPRETEPVPDGFNGIDRFEEALEWCYWHFDARRAGRYDRTGGLLPEGTTMPQEERDAFKCVMRMFYAKWRLAPNDAPKFLVDVLADAKAALGKLEDLGRREDPGSADAAHSWSKARMFVQNVIDTCERRLQS